MIARTNISITDFEQMIARGDFEETPGRIDLIRGELCFMSPPRPEHSNVVSYLNEWSTEQAKKHDYLSRAENPVKFEALQSLVEPDFVWVPRQPYDRTHPTAEQVVLIIEVAYSSLRKDRGKMRRLYAEAGIPEYWIVNCHDACVEVHREPSNRGYQDRFTVHTGDELSPIVAPRAALDLAKLFPGR